LGARGGRKITCALLSLACVVFFLVYFALHRQSEIEEVEEGMGATIKRASG